MSPFIPDDRRALQLNSSNKKRPYTSRIEIRRNSARKSGDHQNLGLDTRKATENVKSYNVNDNSGVDDEKINYDPVFQRNLSEAMNRISRLQKQKSKSVVKPEDGRKSAPNPPNSRINESYKLMTSRTDNTILVTSKHLIDGSTLDEKPRPKTTGQTLRTSLRRTSSSNDFGNTLFKVGFMMSITKAKIFDPLSKENDRRYSLPPAYVFRGHMLGSPHQHWSTVDVVRDMNYRKSFDPVDGFTNNANMRMLKLLMRARVEEEMESFLPILPKRYQLQMNGLHDPLKSYQRRRMSAADAGECCFE